MSTFGNAARTIQPAEHQVAYLLNGTIFGDQSATTLRGRLSTLIVVLFDWLVNVLWLMTPLLTERSFNSGGFADKCTNSHAVRPVTASKS